MAQFLKLLETTTLPQLADAVGSRNVSAVLSLNDMVRSRNVGVQHYDKVKQIKSQAQDVNWQTKQTILNKMTTDSDVFEQAALSSESEWKVIANMNTFSGYLRMPDTVKIPDSVNVLGNQSNVSKQTYDKVMKSLSKAPHTIDPGSFNEYNSASPANFSSIGMSGSSSNVLQFFNIPWGEVTLYDSLSGESMDFPVYPEEPSDPRKANYTTMPDTLFQYEPFYVYQSSGPRNGQYVFTFHRDMWTGDHRDGMANKLIRFCQACLYPQYNGSAVNTPTVTLYVHGEILIQGIMTNVTPSWTGPILQDGWFAVCKLELEITEVSPEPLSYDSVRAKESIIG